MWIRVEWKKYENETILSLKLNVSDSGIKLQVVKNIFFRGQKCK